MPEGTPVRRQTEYDVVASIGGRRRKEQSDERAEDRATSRAEDKLADAERRATGDHADGYSTNRTGGYVECPESRCEAYKRRQSIDGEAKEQDAKAAETEKAENDARSHVRDPAVWRPAFVGRAASTQVYERKSDAMSSDTRGGRNRQARERPAGRGGASWCGTGSVAVAAGPDEREARFALDLDQRGVDRRREARVVELDRGGTRDLRSTSSSGPPSSV